MHTRGSVCEFSPLQSIFDVTVSRYRSSFQLPVIGLTRLCYLLMPLTPLQSSNVPPNEASHCRAIYHATSLSDITALSDVFGLNV